jgi:hypothetical protein
MGDVFSFLVQSTGAGLMSSGGAAKLGQDIVIAGLLIQIASFGLFIAIVVVFNVRYRQYNNTSMAHGGRRSRLPDEVGDSQARDIPWSEMLWILYAISALIMVRSIFRIVEYAMGSDGYVLQHEWTLYVFDSCLMSLTMVIFYLRCPSKIGTTSHLQESSVLHVHHNGNNQKQGT